MDIRQLRYFVSAIRQGSLRAAAREHFVTQPAVSIQLKNLEQELGEKLYVRRGRRIEPTQAGITVLSGAEDIIGRMEALTHRLGALKTLEHGSLKMGSIDAASIYVLPGVFRAFRSRYPGIDSPGDRLRFAHSHRGPRLGSDRARRGNAPGRRASRTTWSLSTRTGWFS